jgi:ABC-type uncharacterized transport system substrate-binding protein
MTCEHFRRRQFITLLGGAAAAWPVAARAQQPAGMPVIGWLSSRNAETDAPVLPIFRRALSTYGYVEGRNVTIAYRYANSELDRLPELVAGLVRDRVALIIAFGDGVLVTKALQAATSTIPIVFTTGADPVRTGLVPNLNRPGGNTTGVVGMTADLGQKRMGLLHELLPRAATIAVLANPSNPDNLTQAADVQEAARMLGKQTRILRASTDRELNETFANLAQMRTDALHVNTNPFFFTRADEIITAAARLALPATYFRREFAVAGGLMSYGINSNENYRVLGDYAGRILKGEKAGDLPVQQSTKFEFVINLKTAKVLGLAVPPMLLALTDEVIE